MSTAGGMAATVAVIAARQRQELLEKFRRKGATSPSSALTVEQLELGGNPMLRMQIRERAVVEVGEGRYYLDQKVAEKQEHGRRILITALTGILVLALLIFWLIG